MFKWEGEKVQSQCNYYHHHHHHHHRCFMPIFLQLRVLLPYQLLPLLSWQGVSNATDYGCFILNWANIKFACSFVGTALQLSDTQKTAKKYYYCKLENVEQRLLRFALCASCSETFGSAQCRPTTDTWLRFANWPQCAHSEHTDTATEH